MYLEKINSPADLKQMSLADLNLLAGEMRHYLLEKLSQHGGHIGPNLGMVEITIALHYVFNSPKDKFVFDVSHQSYPHKMLTGRRLAFMNPEHYDDVSGYTEPSESEHDHFIIGHTSTSISLACGLAKGRDLAGDSENIIAIIGDGSLSGGEALEGLNVAGSELNSNLVIIVNDNQMSIAENHGGIYEGLRLLRETKGEARHNIFRAMGLNYVYVDDGHQLKMLIETFKRVKDTARPIVIHINTVKGKGYSYAEADKENWHWGGPFNLSTGISKFVDSCNNYHDITAEYLLKLMSEHPQLIAMTAGTPGVLGFTPERRIQAGKQFVDVGIAEETAVAMASGIAQRGGKPVWGVSSTFIQRAYDQISQDLCINNNPALILVFGGGINSMRDVTHTCFYDIPLLGHIPNLVYLAPTCYEEYVAMLDWAVIYRKHPVAIRVPINGVINRTQTPVSRIEWDIPQYEITKKGSKVAIIALGSFYQLGEELHEELQQREVNATLVNPRLISALDETTLTKLQDNHQIVITLEDGQAEGGWGEQIARFYGPTSTKVLVRGERKQFEDRFNVQKLMAANRLTPKQMADDLLSLL